MGFMNRIFYPVTFLLVFLFIGCDLTKPQNHEKKITETLTEKISVSGVVLGSENPSSADTPLQKQSPAETELPKVEAKPPQNMSENKPKEPEIELTKKLTKTDSQNNKNHTVAIPSLKYPEKIRAGETFQLTITADRPEETSRYIFNGIVHEAPSHLHVYRAAEHAVRNATKLPSGAVTYDKSGYVIFVTVPFPQDGKEYTVWVRYRAREFCLRRPDKEIKWIWGSPSEFRWVNTGRFTAETIGTQLAIMNGANAPHTEIDQILFTTANDLVFRPEDGLGNENIFTWTPAVSAVGKHTFTAAVEIAGQTAEKKFEVEVLPAPSVTESSEPELKLAPEDRIDLTPKDIKDINADIDPKKIPALQFINDTYRALLQEIPFGLNFPNNFMLPLRADVYPDLPNRVELPIDRKLGGLAFLLTEYLQGEIDQEMAHFLVRYADGTEEKIPLREEVELCGQMRNRNPRGGFFAGTVLSSSADEYNLTVAAWKNPHPNKNIKTIVFSNIRSALNQPKKEENPLNVAHNSSQILLGILGIVDNKKAETITKTLIKIQSETSDVSTLSASVTVDFDYSERNINPYVFSTNESGYDHRYDRYLSVMKVVNCCMFRFLGGFSLDTVYPNGKMDQPNYAPYVEMIKKARAVNPHYQAMFCMRASVDFSKPEGRQLFADLCADFVREMNIKEQLGLTHWEIYNEPYANGIPKERWLWHAYNLAATQMKQVDPSIKIGGYAPCWPVMGYMTDFYQHCHENVDFLSWHKYPTGSADTPTKNLMAGTSSFENDAIGVRAIVERITPGKNVELAITEYNINYSHKPHDPRQAAHIGAAWMASVLNHLIRGGVDIAQTWHSRGGGTYGLFDSNNKPRPTAKLLYVANNFIKGKQVWAQSSVPAVECLAFRNENTAGAMLVNKSPKPVTVTMEVLNPPDFAKSLVVPETRSFSISETGFADCYTDDWSKGTTWSVTLTPYEVRVFVSPFR
jgi:hypothetical protein